MRITVEFWEVPEFSKDVAHYAVSDGFVSRLRQNLADNPHWGDARVGDTGVRDWEIGGFCVTYHVSSDLGRIILLRIKPRNEPRGDFTEKALKFLRLLNEIKNLFKGNDSE